MIIQDSKRAVWYAATLQHMIENKDVDFKAASERGLETPEHVLALLTLLCEMKVI